MLYSSATEEFKQLTEVIWFVFLKRSLENLHKTWQNENIFKTTPHPSKPTENNKNTERKKKSSPTKQGKDHNHKPQNTKIIFQILRNFVVRNDVER